MLSAATLLFPPFRLDTANQQLWRESQLLPLRPKTYKVLLYFARNSQRLVTKEELLNNVWAGVSVSGELLRVYIRELRRILGDEPHTPRYIETVTARGYRFLPPVASGPFSQPGEDGPRETDPTLKDGSAADLRTTGPSLSLRRSVPIPVGILHSLTGYMAWGESPVIDATLLAIEEINQRGGILGRRIQPLVVDGQSNDKTFSIAAKQLITEKRVCTLFGCWTSASRKTVLPIVEQLDHLLVYPTRNEGMEQSPNILYTGATPNQQVIPAVRWAYGILGKKRFFLIGWNSVYSHATNAIIRDEVAALGGEIVGEQYLPPLGADVAAVTRTITRSKPDLIFSSVAGDINMHYTRALRTAGVTPDKVPTVYFCINEIELLSFSAREVMGDYAAWNYFQSLDSRENHAFVNRFRTRFGLQRAIADPMEAGYVGVHLWARAVEAAGSVDVPAIRQALRNVTLEAPEGPVRIDPANQHTWKTVRVGKIIEGGQFEVIWSSEKPIRPETFPGSRTPGAWRAFLEDLFKRWSGHWTKPHG